VLRSSFVVGGFSVQASWKTAFLPGEIMASGKPPPWGLSYVH